MKTVSFALLLMATLAFVVVGCSDNSAVPVSPTDQSAQTPASLEKSNKVDFTFEAHNIPPAIPAKMWVADGVLQIRDAHAFEAVTAELEPRATGTMEHYLSLSLDVVTGEGPCHGSFTLTPANDAAKAKATAKPKSPVTARPAAAIPRNRPERPDPDVVPTFVDMILLLSRRGPCVLVAGIETGDVPLIRDVIRCARVVVCKLSV